MYNFPTTRSEAKRWNYLNKQDSFFKIREWPYSMQKLGIKDQLFNIERLNLLTFLLGNGLYPDRAMEFMRLNRTYDKAAEHQMKWILKHWKTYKRAGYWDMTLRRYMRYK